MKKTIFFLFFLSLCSFPPIISGTNTVSSGTAGTLPRVVILATGGTIAGSAETSTQASYQPAKIDIGQILSSIPAISNVASVKGIQVCNIASQNMELAVWLKLYNIIDSLFINDICDGVVITHGTDTMEESAYFLNLTINHSRPVVLTGSMRPSTSLSPDGPFNLFNAISLAASPKACNQGVMVLMNDLIYSADDVTKTNSVNTNAFSCPNYGALGRIRDGEPYFFRRSLLRHTVNSEFNIKGLKNLPQVEILYSYAFSSDVLIRSLIESGVDGIIIAGVGHGNYNRETAEMMKEALERGIVVVRSTRVFSGGVDTSAEEYDPKYPVAYMKNPQKARILLMLALSRYGNGNLQLNGTSTASDTRIKEIQRIFAEY